MYYKICTGLPLVLFLGIGVYAQEGIHLMNARVFDGMDVHFGWSVVTKGNEIIYAGPAKPKGSYHEELDLSGHTLLPGLIEGHSHLFLHPYNETTWNDQVLKESYAERTVRAVNHANATLMAGFTTVRDLGTEGADYLDVGLRDAINKGLMAGPKMLVAGKAIVATGSYGPKGFAPHVGVPLGAEAADGVDLIRVTRDQIGHGVDVIKVYADYRWGLMGEAAPTFSISELKSIVETAHASGRQVVAHASSKEGMRRAILAGVTTIEHGDAADREIYDLMVAHDVALCPTLAAGDAIMQYRGWNKMSDSIPERIILKKKSFADALQSGVTICAGGDVGVFPHGENVRELEMMVDYGMSELEVLRSVTSTNARVFDMPDLGKIQSGFQADLIAVQGNPDTNISALRHVNVVMRQGKMYKSDLTSQH
ncbi:MAG: amidohydrolase family protein [Saprospiraceae bacterium]|nr:amidohydrolase family protein [Saprospiraceae bacterium]